MINLICPALIIVNFSGEPWKEIDQKNLDVAKYRCIQIFEDSPCLKKFIKKEPRTYNAICSPPEKRK